MTKFLSILTFIISVVCINTINAQSPNSFNYQAIVRQSNGEIIANQIVSIKISILSNSVNGVANYIEFHRVATNDYGLINIQIGLGSPLMGSFNNIQWANNSHYIKTEIDEKGGNNYVFLGVSQLLSVPYALNAKTAENVDDADADPLNEIQVITRTGNEISLSKNGGTVSITDNDNDSLNEIQTLALTGNQLSISKGNTITLNGAVDLDADPTNELQTLSLNGRKLEISQGNYIEIPFDNDNDSLNEIQSISFKNDTVFLSKSNHIVLPDNKDNDPTNELQILSLKNDTLYLSQGNYVILPKDNDTDPTNELQNIEFKNDSITISNGKGISLKDLNNKLRNEHMGVSYFKNYDLKLDSVVKLGDFTLQASNEHILDFVIDNSGNYIILIAPNAVSGDFITKNLTFKGFTNTVHYLIKFNKNLDILWYKTISCGGNNCGMQIKKTNLLTYNDTIYLSYDDYNINTKIENLTLTERFILKILPNGNIYKNYDFGKNSAVSSTSYGWSNPIIDSKGNIFFCRYITNQFNTNIELYKLDKNFNVQIYNYNNNIDRSTGDLNLIRINDQNFIIGIKASSKLTLNVINLNDIILHKSFSESGTLGSAGLNVLNNNIMLFSKRPSFWALNYSSENIVKEIIASNTSLNLNLLPIEKDNEFIYLPISGFLPNQKNSFLNQLTVEPLNKNNIYIFKINSNGNCEDVKPLISTSEIYGGKVYNSSNKIYSIFYANGTFDSNNNNYSKGLYIFKAF